MDADELVRLTKLQGARLKEARKLRGYKSAAACARRFGWKESTYTSHENGTRAIGRAYRECAKKLKVNWDWLLGKDVDRDATVQGVSVIGSAELGVWRERRNGHPPDIGPRKIPVPDQEGAGLDERFAIRVADSSINKVIPQGAYAVCAYVEDALPLEALVVGQLLYVERTQHGMTELSFRRVISIDGKVAKLSSWSADPRLRHEISYPARETEMVTIIGRVIGKYEDLSPVC